MRPLTSITAAATLGMKPERSAFGGRSQKSLLIAAAAARDVTVASEPGKGSVFTVRMPARSQG